MQFMFVLATAVYNIIDIEREEEADIVVECFICRQLYIYFHPSYFRLSKKFMFVSHESNSEKLKAERESSIISGIGAL